MNILKLIMRGAYYVALIRSILDDIEHLLDEISPKLNSPAFTQDTRDRLQKLRQLLAKIPL